MDGSCRRSLLECGSQAVKRAGIFISIKLLKINMLMAKKELACNFAGIDILNV
jgi:hypothetical protein